MIHAKQGRDLKLYLPLIQAHFVDFGSPIMMGNVYFYSSIISLNLLFNYM